MDTTYQFPWWLEEKYIYIYGGQLRQSTYMASKWCHLTQGSMGLTETKGCP